METPLRLLSANDAESIIAPVVTPFEMNPRHCFVSASACGFECRSQRGYGQDAPTCGHNLAIRATCAGMKDFYGIELSRILQTGNRFLGLIFPWITARGQHNRNGRALVPFDCVPANVAVNSRFEERQ